MKGATEQVAEWIVGHRHADLDASAVDAVQLSFIDTVGCLCAGLGERSARVVRDSVTSGADLPASVVGLRDRASAVEAALANGVSAHALDYDDYDLISYVHPGVVLVPALLAAGQLRGATGRDVIEAYATAYEVMQCIGSIVCPHHYVAGFHGTGTIGTIGAAVAVAKLNHLTIDGTRTALGIAASLAAGLRANFGSDVKPLHAGRAASSGVLAAHLASKGYEAARNIVEAEFGIVHTFAPDNRGDIDSAVDRLVRGEISVGRNPPTIKPFPSCGATHAAIEAVLRLRVELGVTSAAQVTSVLVEAPELSEALLIHHRPSTPLQAKFSMEGCVALALVDGQVGLAQFEDTAIQRRDVAELIGRIAVRADAGLEQQRLRNASLPARVTVDAGGARRTVAVDDSPGSSSNPLKKDDVLAKFDDCTRGTLDLGDQKGVRDLLGELPIVTDITLLIDALTRGAAGSSAGDPDRSPR